MNCKSIRKNLKSVITNLITVVIGLVFFQSCSDDILTGQPSWLGNSIYEYLQDQGDYTNTIKLINDLDYATVLNQTGSKTLFVANDDAYTEFFKSNKWGVHSYDELSMAQKKLLLNSSMVNNAYLIELLSSIPGTPPLEGRCMRRESAITIYDSVAHILPSQMPQTNYWNKYRNKTNGIVLMRDNSPAPIIHFLPKYMQVNSITDEDLQILTNGASNSVSDAWVNGKKIIDRDITCKNGYVQKLDGVMTSADNMAEIIRGHKNMSVWTHLMNRYCAPYYDDTSTKQYNRLYNNSDSVFVLKYFSSCSKSGTTKVDPDGNTVSSLLTFDPEWNQYIQNDGSGQTLNYDCGAMLVPSNEAMSYWWEHDGLALQTEYGTMDNVPDNVMLQLINVHMIPSFANHVPSKFSNITNDANMEMGVTKADVDSCFMGCNGVVYLTNKVFSPAAYSSVSFPALIRSNSNMAIIYWAIKNLGFSQYLNSMDSYYSMLLPTDNAFLNYIDPCSYGSSTTVLYKFKWSTEKQAPQIERYRYNMNTHTVIDKIDTRDVGTNKSSDLGANRLYDIVDNLIIVDKLVDGKNYYKTKGGATVRISNHDVKGAMTVSEGMEEKALGKTLTVSEIYDQTRSGNGKSYEIDGGVPLSTNKSVYATLKDNSEYSRFFDLISGGDDNNPDENLMVNLIDKKYSCVDYNIRLFNAYNYT
nr:fasciclin domain-containing protein [Prevotella sp.]